MKTVLLLTLLSLFGFTQSSSHVGEKAYYQVDPVPARTSPIIKSGSFTFEVASLSGQTYMVKMIYDLTLKFPIGRQQGQKGFELDESYFTPEFWAKLRKEGSYEGSKVKMRHEGYKTVKTLDGRTYKDCDVVRMYDIDTSDAIMTFDEDGLETEHQITDLIINAKIKEGIPSIRAAMLDISGKMDGNPFIVGSDYIKGNFYDEE